ncbi:hypothetical protein BMS3Bbin04_01054 [bacterium BMS3Bbin04]|nr:hypothetical protein BMS3Bbin04_01054 [bacterium BMS3Bbin04]
MRVLLLTLSVLLTVSFCSLAGPPMTGTWTLADSPVELLESSTIPEGQTLTILAGVEVLVMENCRLDVRGQLIVLGSENTPVVFTSYTPGTDWWGIVIHGLNQDLTSTFEYAHIFNTIVGLTAIDGDVLVRSSKIQSNRSAIFLQEGSFGELRESTFSVTSSTSDAKTAYVFRSKIDAEDCTFNLTISNVTASPAGGAIQIYSSREGSRIVSCRISASSQSGANAIRLLNCDNNVTLNRTAVHTVRTGGFETVDCAAIYCSQSDLRTLDRMSIHMETDAGSMFGIYVTDGADVRLMNSIIAATNVGATSERYAAFVDPNSTVSSIHFEYVCVDNMQLDNDTDYFTKLDGSILEVDPLWTNPDLENYHLLLESPCIDAGSPTGEQDPDGSLPDLGAYVFEGLLVPDNNPEPVSSFELSHAWPNPFNAATHFSIHLQQRVQVQVRVLNVLGRTVTELADQQFDAGDHTFTWPAQGSQQMASGIYLLQVIADGNSHSQRLVLLK